jgi:hypothetical protein
MRLNGLPSTERLKSILVTYERVNGDGIGGLGHNRAEVYFDTGSGSNLANCGDGLSNGDGLGRGYENVSYLTGKTSLGAFFVADTASGVDIVEIYIDKIECIYEINYSPGRAIITEESSLCP